MKRPAFTLGSKGFTIVELLIVVVVIGVLASIVVVAFNNVSARARNNARITEMVAWKKLFEAYRATNGNVPTIPGAPGGVGYCLGTGFPSTPGSGNVPRCRDTNCTSPNCYLESDGLFIATALSSVGRVPSSPKIPVTNNVVGPYLMSYDPFGYQITGWLEGDTSVCVPPTRPGWTDGTGRASCIIDIDQ